MTPSDVLARGRAMATSLGGESAPGFREHAETVRLLCERIEALQSGAGIIEAFDAGAAQAREPSAGMRLVGYRAAALSAIAGTKIDDGGKTAERRTAEACERYAHAMLAAERPPEAAPAPLPGLSVDDRAVLRNAMISAQENGDPAAWGDRFRGKVVAALAKVLGEDGAPTVATCARCGALPDASAGVVLVPGMAAAGLRRGYVCEDVHACAERQEAP